MEHDETTEFFALFADWFQKPAHAYTLYLEFAAGSEVVKHLHKYSLL